MRKDARSLVSLGGMGRLSKRSGLRALDTQQWLHAAIRTSGCRCASGFCGGRMGSAQPDVPSSDLQTAPVFAASPRSGFREPVIYWTRQPRAQAALGWTACSSGEPDRAWPRPLEARPAAPRCAGVWVSASRRHPEMARRRCSSARAKAELGHGCRLCRRGLRERLPSRVGNGRARFSSSSAARVATVCGRSSSTVAAMTHGYRPASNPQRPERTAAAEQVRYALQAVLRRRRVDGRATVPGADRRRMIRVCDGLSAGAPVPGGSAAGARASRRRSGSTTTDRPAYGKPRELVESRWVPEMQALLDLDQESCR